LYSKERDRTEEETKGVKKFLRKKEVRLGKKETGLRVTVLTRCEDRRGSQEKGLYGPNNGRVEREYPVGVWLANSTGGY